MSQESITLILAVFLALSIISNIILAMNNTLLVKLNTMLKDFIVDNFHNRNSSSNQTP